MLQRTPTEAHNDEAQNSIPVCDLTFVCPEHKSTLKIDTSKNRLIGSCGCTFPLIEHIPRFVSSENYASSFGLQWNTFRKTQLDSFTGVSISKDRLTRLAGGNLEIFNGQTVLEAGCGAGRFTEILLESGAQVFATDISVAVEANYQNCHQYSRYFVAQADLLHLPVQLEQFDIVVCVGVIQHTPDPEKTMSVLCSYLKPGGLLIMDHYTHGYSTTPSRKALRSFY